MALYSVCLQKNCFAYRKLTSLLSPLLLLSFCFYLLVYSGRASPA